MKTETQFTPAADLGGPGRAFVAPVAAALVVLGLLAAFWPTAASIESIWRRAETFTHGYVVIPIVLWLVWRKRHALATLPVKPFWPALVVVAGAGFAWMAGNLAGVLGLEHFALYFMLVGALVAVLGLPMTREIAFPLAFLAFAVPFGEFLVPVLIDRTADFTIAALRASGVPVFREGNHFAIPSGRWSVVEACSGIRYLIASMMVGALYAHLTYRSLRKRVLFFLASIVVPIIANWLRAYLIVMLGHLTNNRLAVGVDHLIYGWLFFGLVMAAMFWIGAYWRDDEEAPRSAAPLRWAPAVRPAATGPVALAVVLTLALGVVWWPIGAAVDAHSQVVSAKLPPIAAAGGWQPAPGPQHVWTPHYLGAQSELHQWFAKDGRTVGVYVALYSQQSQGKELIVSGNELVIPKGSDGWVKVAERRAPLQWGGEDITARAAQISGSETYLSARAWYWVNGQSTASDMVAKALLALAKMSLKPDHSAVIVIYTPQPDAKTLDTRPLDAFARDMSGAVMAALRKATGE